MKLLKFNWSASIYNALTSAEASLNLAMAAYAPASTRASSRSLKEDVNSTQI
jgi:hypothetical protein